MLGLLLLGVLGAFPQVRGQQVPGRRPWSGAPALRLLLCAPGSVGSVGGQWKSGSLCTPLPPSWGEGGTGDKQGERRLQAFTGGRLADRQLLGALFPRPGRMPQLFIQSAIIEQQGLPAGGRLLAGRGPGQPRWGVRAQKRLVLGLSLLPAPGP